MVNGAVIKNEYNAVERDTAFGMTAEQIANGEDERARQSGGTTALVLQRDRAIRGIPMLRKERIGIFAGK